MLERGFVIGATRLIRRAWQIYVAHIILFVMYIAEIGYLAHRYGDPNLENEFNVAGFMANPAETLYQGLILAFKPVNMDVLPLYILLMVVFPPILWTMLRLPNLTLAASFLLYLAARHFDWNLAAFPTGSWYFNPFCWQFLFIFGGWFALGGSIEARPLIRSRALLWLGSAYLLFALRHDDGGTISGDRSHDAGMALRCVQSQRQNQSRTLPPRPFHRSCLFHQQVLAA